MLFDNHGLAGEFFHLLIGTVLYGQGTNPLALFIDEHGNVGIGTNNPQAGLDVKGSNNRRC
ncbi:MAG TPA: hypothetical protein VIU36_05660, partial [Gammaproteobacteria bacterium]